MTAMLVRNWFRAPATTWKAVARSSASRGSGTPRCARCLLSSAKIGRWCSPLIGRKVKDGKREWVMGQGTRGCVALYRFVADIDTVFVLAFRSRREAGYER